MEQVGRPVRRKEGRAKVTGEALYVDDVTQAGLLHGVTVRSPVARGRITAIHFDPAIDWSEFVVVTAADIPGRNRVKLIADDQPYLAFEQVNHPEEPVVLIAHADAARADEARRRVTIDIEPLPPVLTIDEALAGREIIWGSDNIFKRYSVSKGDVDSAFAGPDVIIVEGVYETGAQEQLYIEPMGMLAMASPRNGVTVWGSMQCPYYIHTALAALFAIAPERIRVVQMETGGGFGGKEEYPSIIAGHAALLAWKSGKPVKMIYGRSEDMAATPKRRPSRTRHRTAVTRDGRLLAMDIDFAIDGGAYATLSSVVLLRGTIHAAGPYRCDNVRIRSTAVATNAPPHGAFRGFGAPQSLFALERHMDKVARAVGLAPDEFRKRNFLQTGDATATGQIITQELNLKALQSKALDAADYRSKTAQFQKENKNSTRKRGIGFATFFHGAGFTGSGERYLQSVVELELDRDGRVCILASMTEMGQGTNTVLTQIVAETLGADYRLVEIRRPDTAEVPNSGPTVASRTSMVIGRLLENAAGELKTKLLDTGFLPESYTPQRFRDASRRYAERFGPTKIRVKYEEPPGIY